MDVVLTLYTKTLLMLLIFRKISDEKTLNTIVQRSVNDRRKEIGKRNAVVDNYTWPNGIIPYIVSATITDFQARFICKAMTDIEQHTCVKFKPLTREISNNKFVYITNNGPFCAATVGYDSRKTISPFFINLDASCFVKRGTVEHELLHVIGLYHEQARPDRNAYVQINENDIPNDMLQNFGIVDPFTVRTFNLPYDVNSVMHYPSHVYSVKFPTILSKLFPDTIMGQREGPSILDFKKVHLMYNCKKAGTPLIDPFKPTFKAKLMEFMSIKRDENFDRRMLSLIHGLKQSK